MATARFSRARQDAGDYWPGFVDALATLLLVAIFMLSVYTAVQFVLGRQLTDKDAALADLRAQVSALNIALGAAEAESDALEAEVTRLQLDLGAAQSRVAAAAAEVAAAEGRSALMATALDDERELSAAAQAEVALLRAEIAALNQAIAQLNAALEAAEALDAEQKVQIENLSQRLNTALARKAQELAKVRSEFFEKLTNALGERSDIRVVGDRFVFETDVVFASGDAALTPEGRRQLAAIARVIGEIANDIPDDLDWIIRVDGHTDVRAINTPEFPSNWYLSAARAISVVNYFESTGIESKRLVAAGFGEHYPIDDRRTNVAFTRNRRIELKLDSR